MASLKPTADASKAASPSQPSAPPHLDAETTPLVEKRPAMAPAPNCHALVGELKNAHSLKCSVAHRFSANETSVAASSTANSPGRQRLASHTAKRTSSGHTR